MGIVGGRRRAVGRMVMAACVGSLLLGAAGCTAPSTPAPTSNPPTVAPIFASDEEAVAAATEAYANYQEMSDRIDGEGGVSQERIAPFVSERYLATAVHQSDGFVEAQAKSVGSTTFQVSSVQHLEYRDPDETSISLYVCDDVTGVDVIDASGTSLVTESRVSVTPFEVTFTIGTEMTLVVDSREIWEGANFCQ